MQAFAAAVISFSIQAYCNVGFIDLAGHGVAAVTRLQYHLTPLAQLEGA